MIERLRARPGWQQVPAVMVTGSVSPDIEQRARALEVLQAVYEIAGRPVPPYTLQLMLAGDGPLVVMCHGYPGLWYSWRHQR